jgi:hypothetical protein
MLLRSPAQAFDIRDEPDVDYDATLPPLTLAELQPSPSPVESQTTTRRERLAARQAVRPTALRAPVRAVTVGACVIALLVVAAAVAVVVRRPALAESGPTRALVRPTHTPAPTRRHRPVSPAATRSAHSPHRRTRARRATESRPRRQSHVDASSSSQAPAVGRRAERSAATPAIPSPRPNSTSTAAAAPTPERPTVTASPAPSGFEQEFGLDG